MDRKQARQIVLDQLNDEYDDPDDSIVILDEWTVDKPYGWIFFFNTKRYIHTGDFLYALAGNGPVVFELEGSVITGLGSARPPEETVLEFEEERGLTSGTQMNGSDR